MLCGSDCVTVTVTVCKPWGEYYYFYFCSWCWEHRRQECSDLILSK